MPSRLRRLVPLFVLPALVAAGCGSSGGGDTGTASLLKDTFSAGKTVRSGKLDVSLGFQAQGLPTLTGPIAFRLIGPFASQGAGKLPKFDFALDIAAGGQTIQAGATSLGDHGFIKLGGRAYTVDKALFDQFRSGYEKSQRASASKDNSNASFKALGISPSTWLKDARKAGKADVGGTSTFHITSGVDVPRFLTDVDRLLGKAKNLGAGAQGVPKGISDKVRTAIERSVKSARVDVYTGEKDHALRRIALRVSLVVPKDVQKTAGGLTSGELRFDLTLADLNADQTIPEPKGARPLSELQQALTALTGGSASSSSSTTPAPSQPDTTTSATPPAAGSSKYTDCVKKAGTDIAKVQQCAALVNGG